MTTLTIRGLPASITDALKLRAAAGGRSLEAELRTILTHAAEGKAPTDAEELGAYLRPAIVVLHGICLRVGLKLGAEKAAEMLAAIGHPHAEPTPATFRQCAECSSPVACAGRMECGLGWHNRNRSA